MKSLKPITIIGGGLAGLTLGIGLRKKSVPVSVVEAAHYPRHRVCGEFICGLGRNVLERFDLNATLTRAGALEAETALFQGRAGPGPVRRLPAKALCISRFVLDAELARAFQALGGELQEQQRWRETEFREGMVRATGRRLKPSETKARWFGLKVHARNVPLAADLEMHLVPDGYVGICRLPGDEVNVCGLFRRSSGELPSGDARGLLLRSPNKALRQRLEEAEIEEGSFCSVAGLSLAPVPARPGECCVGDALTMIPPVTGNGMSMAFESADLALDPIAAYSEGTVSWQQAQAVIAVKYRQAFASRLQWAKWLHVFLFSGLFKLLGPSALRSEMLWRTLFRQTR